MASEEVDIWDREIEVREAKGILDVSQEYRWELTQRVLRRGVIFGRDAPQEYRGKQLSDLDQEEREEINPKWVADIIELHFQTLIGEQSVALKESAWVSDVLTLNTTNLQYQSRLATLVQRMGGELTPNQKIKLGDYVQEGLQFDAHPRAQRDKQGKETGYHELDLETITNVKKGTGVKAQAKISVTDIADDVKAAIQDIVDGAEALTKEDAIKGLIEAKRTDLMGAFLDMDTAGEFTWN